MIVIYVLQTLLPLTLVLWMALLPPRNLVGFWLLSVAAALLILMVALQGVWVFPPWWVPYLLALSLVAAVTLHLIRARGRPVLPTSGLGYLPVAMTVVIAGYSGAQSWTAISARQIPQGQAIDLGWPLAPGIYLVANGGASPSINAHAALIDPSHPLHAGFGGSGYGVDLVAVNRWGFRTRGIQPSEPAAYAIFGTPVLAPCAGEVVVAEGDRPDMPVPMVDDGYPAGSHILLRCASIDILLGHFRQGSVRVSTGDSIALGQQIAEVGNSGETGEPHLHIHAQLPGTTERPFSGTPVPIRLEGRFLVRNDIVDITVPPHSPSLER
ncbi:M23 family metallopeptidase [Rhodovulum tesquicola]|uniref:M23 family metallopeptidase n=1 Tax=Rhodovulum tesquicola TaxID=540254 RepID=UPI0020972ADB|nr:M23 family metallopeptidase [Rhodovulum tesquicola]MCO8146018.1 M23 family metallopeptidase [Rhodovulum tesquicola]